MISRINQVHKRAHLIHHSIDATIAMLKANNLNPDIVWAENSQYMQSLNHFYFEELQLAKLMSTSDFVLHVEGPTVVQHNPDSKIFSWLIESVNTTVKRFLNASNTPSDNYNLRLDGFATGSIFAGFTLDAQQQQNDLLNAELTTMIANAKKSINNIISVKDFLDNNGLSETIIEAIANPVMRDSAVKAAYDLSPTGRARGIHSVELITNSGSNSAEFTPNSRALLKKNVTSPVMNKKMIKHGSFVGEFRAVNLDKDRLDLRNIDAVGIESIRCVMPNLTSKQASALLGSRVKITGSYETLENGMPALFKIEAYEPMPQQSSLI
jgi:hypothetical protein